MRTPQKKGASYIQNGFLKVEGGWAKCCSSQFKGDICKNKGSEMVTWEEGIGHGNGKMRDDMESMFGGMQSFDVMLLWAPTFDV